MEYGIVTYTRLPKEVKSELDAIALKEYTTVASLLRRAAEQFLAARAIPATRKTKRHTVNESTASR